MCCSLQGEMRNVPNAFWHLSLLFGHGGRREKPHEEAREGPDANDPEELEDIQKCAQWTVYRQVVWRHLSSSHRERESCHQLCRSVQLMQSVNLQRSKFRFNYLFILHPHRDVFESAELICSTMVLTWKIMGMTGHDGDLIYLAYCSNANCTTIPTRYGARVAEAAGPVHGQTKPIVTIGIMRLSTKTATEEIRCPNWRFRVLLYAAETGTTGLCKWSTSRRNTATPQ